jgi:hypothetical protein
MRTNLKENYLYFAGIDGGGGDADASADAGCWAASRLAGVSPITATTTGIYFYSALKDVTAEGGGAGDLVTITHADTTGSNGAGHRCRFIAEAVATACNANPHNPGMVTVFDHDNEIYFSRMNDVKGDSGFDMVITIDS